MGGEMPEYYCKRIKSDVVAENMNDITGRISVGCINYTGTNKHPCNHDLPRFRDCFVKLAVQKETREKSRLTK